MANNKSFVNEIYDTIIYDTITNASTKNICDSEDERIFKELKTATIKYASPYNNGTDISTYYPSITGNATFTSNGTYTIDTFKFANYKSPYMNDGYTLPALSFDELPQDQKIYWMKLELQILVNDLCGDTNKLNDLVALNKISNEESEIILKTLTKSDIINLKLDPIPKELEPLIDIARERVNQKRY